jgi:hypothetical protein
VGARQRQILLQHGGPLDMIVTGRGHPVYAWDQGPEPDEKDIQWLATESAAAALDA